MTQRRGARWSCADAYLKPVLHRRNLTLLTDSTVRRVLIGGGRAVGVEFDDAEGRRQTVWAAREVVLSAGAVNTPQLLMLSGIGDEKELAEFGIGVVHHAPEVGRNLMDHLVCPMGFAVRDGSLFDAEKPRQLVDYLARRRGMLTSNIGEAYGFVRSRPELELPDLELIWAPAPFFDEGIGEPYGHAIATGPILLTPLSRGAVTLRSADPFAKPVIDPRYLSDSDGVDRAAMMEGLRVTATIARSPALRDVVGEVVRPLARHDIGRRDPGTGTRQLLPHPLPPGRDMPDGHATTAVSSTRSCGFVACADFGWPTRRSCRPSSADTPTPRPS